MDHPAEHLVFVGNLPFKATQDDLQSFFEPAAAVVEVNIIKRGQRSLGYGFVAFANSADRDAAVAKCHKKELDGREVNVEAAKPKSELPPKEPRAPADQGERRRLPRRRKPAAKKEGDVKQQETEDGVIVSHADGKGKKKRKPKKKAPKAAEGEGEDAAKAPAKKVRVKRERRVPTGEPSKTTVFLANLPFALDNDGLRGVFDGYQVKTATVIVRKITGRSKGFGFLELADEAEQARLLNDVADGKKFVHTEREIGIKVALSEQPKEEEKAE